MVIIFTLQAAYSGATYVAGPFDISGTTSGGVTTLLGNNISKADLLTGVTISDIDDATTGGTIQSVDGVCSNSVQWLVSGGPGGGGLNTYTFVPYCSQNATAHPIGNAPAAVVFTGTELGFTPVGGEFITIGGSGNVDYIFVFDGTTGEAETLHSAPTQVTAQDFTCDGPIV